MAEKERKPWPKPPEVKNAEITDDGAIIVEFNMKLYPHTSRCIFTPELLYGLAEECGNIPPKEETDFPGIPIVTEEDLEPEDEEDDGKEKED
jgi:hypothetical protein